MAKTRVINTKFWDDNYTSNIDPIEKLLFLYILTNTSTNISGVYEIPLKKIANETGIDKDMLLKIIERFERDKKIFYTDGWMWVVNFIKNQNQRSPQVKEGIKRELEAVPSHIKEYVHNKLEGIHTLSHLTKPNLTLPNLTLPNLTKPNLTSSDDVAGVQKIMELFKKINPSLKWGDRTQRKACSEMITEFGLERTVSMVERIIGAQGKQYAPTATTPFVAWKKISDFVVYFNKSNNLTAKI